MKIVVTADKSFVDSQVIYNFVASQMNQDNKIILTGIKYKYQDLVQSMSDKLGVPCEYHHPVTVDNDVVFVKLEEYERCLNDRNE